MKDRDWIKWVDLSRFSLRERTLIVITAISLLAFLFVHFYLPAHREASALADQREQLEKEVSRLQQEQARWVGETKMQSPVETVPGSGLRNYRLATFLKELDRISERVGTELRQILLVKEMDLDVFQAHSFQMELRAGFREAGGFLQEMGELPAIVKINGLKLEADQGKSSAVQMRIDFDIYLEKE